MRRPYESAAIEQKWIERWSHERLSEAVRGKPGEPKFMLHFAYPGISGYLHVGHMRGFTYSDVFCRFHRMTGHRVLFPAGFHASGIPSVGLARRVERQDPATIEYLQANGCPPDVIPRLKDPSVVVDYFSHVYADDYWKRFGFLIDWRTLCTTIDPGYQRFIQWQFRRLQEKQLLVQKPHFAPYCPLDGAVAVDASETDISRGGTAEVIDYTLVLFRTQDGDVLPCATLRPETTFGVTNLWIRPDADYVRVPVGSQRWILSEPAAAKLSHLRPETGHPKQWTRVTGRELQRTKALNPLTGHPVPILPGPFVAPNRGTGVVMSVPAHAPFDWQALHEIQPGLAPIPVIKSPKWGGVPAAEAVKKHGVKSQLDKEALDAATDEIYSDEFNAGQMLPNTGPLVGLRVREAKERVKDLLGEKDATGSFQDFDQDVVCRCGNPVYIRRIPDQWFIKYSDGPLTEESKQEARGMRIFPDDYQRDMPNILDWFGDRACIRRGSWLGTEFPFKKEWIIEPISDSTFYPVYYIVSPYVRAGKLRGDELDDAFFDYVAFGRGRAKNATWDEVRKDFEYWYPPDINLGGKEHKTVHFPPYVMNHVALLPKGRRPRGIFVNWWVTQEAGGKISKSKGGAEPIPGAAQRYSVDGMRLYYCNVASAHVDIEWDPDIVLKYRAHVERLFQFVLDVSDEAEASSPPGLDAWLEATWAVRGSRLREAFEAFDLRAATNQAYYEFYNDLLWFRRRGGRRSPVAAKILQEWVKALTPVTPFLGEELWVALQGKGLASSAQWSPRPAAPDAAALAREDLLRQILEDVGTISRVTKRAPRRILIYTAPPWKRTVAERVRRAVREGRRDVGALIRDQMEDPQIKPHAKDVASFVQRVYKDAVERVGADGDAPAIDEFEILSHAKTFLAQALSVAALEVYRADDAAAPDPGKKRGAAAPLRPALFLE